MYLCLSHRFVVTNCYEVSNASSSINLQILGKSAGMDLFDSMASMYSLCVTHSLKPFVP